MIKEHLDAVLEEYLQSMYNSITKVCISTLEKNAAINTGHLFCDGTKGHGNQILDPIHPDSHYHVKIYSSFIYVHRMDVELTCSWGVLSEQSCSFELVARHF